tara:strand:- start:67 stop:360 length:294 start_codon:yes stop_codon:yes gene_type:complete
MACEDCIYSEMFDPTTKEVTMMADDPNYQCDKCNNTLGCCCTCTDPDELQDDVNDLTTNIKTLERENKELKERLDHLESICNIGTVVKMESKDEQVS